jgi:hypothetical protein
MILGQLRIEMVPFLLLPLILTLLQTAFSFSNRFSPFILSLRWILWITPKMKLINIKIMLQTCNKKYISQVKSTSNSINSINQRIIQSNKIKILTQYLDLFPAWEAKNNVYRMKKTFYPTSR